MASALRGVAWRGVACRASKESPAAIPRLGSCRTQPPSLPPGNPGNERPARRRIAPGRDQLGGTTPPPEPHPLNPRRTCCPVCLAPGDGAAAEDRECRPPGFPAPSPRPRPSAPPPTARSWRLAGRRELPPSPPCRLCPGLSGCPENRTWNRRPRSAAAPAWAAAGARPSDRPAGQGGWCGAAADAGRGGSLCDALV
jgi:hypothetical protein